MLLWPAKVVLTCFRFESKKEAVQSFTVFLIFTASVVSQPLLRLAPPPHGF